MSSEKNRLQNCLTVSNIQLASVVSDTFGKSSQRILDKILENPDDTSFDIEPLIHGSMKKKLPELELAIDGFITPEQPLLVQCANSVVKSEKHPEIRNRYLRLRKRRGHKKAIIAIARMLLTALYNMLKNKEPYNAELYRKSDVLPVNREITIEQAILMAQFQGYKIKSAAE